MQKTIIITTALLLSSITIIAQNVRDAWLTMPDNILPYLTEPLRKQLTIQKQQNDTVNAMVQNHFNTTTTLQHLSDSRLDLYTEMQNSSQDSTKNHSIALTIARLPYETDSVLCVIKTLRAPEPVSFVSIYNKVWKKITDIWFDSVEMTQRLDTLSLSEYNELVKLIEPKMIKAELLADNCTMQLNISLPLTTKEEKERLFTIIVQRKVKWNGKNFK